MKKSWVKELIDYRELFFFFVWRDIKVRYKQTVLGALWAIIQPFFTMIVFTLFFGRVAKIPTDGVPYPIFYYSALVPWIFFSNAISLSGNSLVTNRNLVGKVYFPRIILPTAAVLAGSLDFVIASILVLGMMVYYGFPFSWTVLLWLPLAIMTILLATGVGMSLSALNVRYRDVKYTIPFIMQMWLFITPIIYPSSAIPEKYRFLIGLNPMSGVIEAFRNSIIGKNPVDWSLLGISVLLIVFIVSIGVYYFKKTEQYFADII